MAKKKRSQAKRRVNKIPFIVAGVILAIVLIAAAVYAIVSPSPEERLSRGVIKLLESNKVSIESTSTTKTDASTTISSIKAVTNKKVVDADFSTKVEAEGQETAEVNAEIIIPESGDMYAKVDNPRQSLKNIMNAMLSSQFARNPAMLQPEIMKGMRSMVETRVNTAADQMGDKWVRIPQQDLALTSLGQEVKVGCYVDFVRAAKTDAGARKQLIKHFQANNFLVIDEKLENSGTSAGYQVSVDQEALEEFISKNKGNAVLSTVLECDPKLSLLTNATNGQMSIWVDRLSHSITHIEFADTGVEEAMTEVHIGYSGRIQAAEPENSIDMSELTETLGGPEGTNQTTPATE